MICPICNNKLEEFSPICEECNYIFQPNDYNKFIYEYIEKYPNISNKSMKPTVNENKIIFKNICTENNGDELFNTISAEEFTINHYKQKGYDAFFAENTYWILLFTIIYFSDYFITQHHIYELVSISVFSDDFIEKIGCLNFNNIKNIYSINNLIITSYFENLRWTILEMGVEHYMKHGCGLRDNFTVDELIVSNTYLNKEQLKLIFERMGDDFKYYAYGLPDLIVYNENEFFFVEVKSKNDVPTFRQIQWHKFLTEVVGINVVLFMINKTDREIRNIKKSYEEKLLDSKKRKSIVKDMDLNKSFVNWDEHCFKSLMVVVDDKIFRKNFTTDLDILYKNAVNLYYTDSLKHCETFKKHLNRNKQAKLLENEGDFFNAIELYLDNVVEKTANPTTFKRLIFIFNKFNRYDDINELMNIAIPIFISIGDKKNSLKFLYQKMYALHGKGSFPPDYLFKEVKNDIKGEKDKQTDLSSYFN